MYREMKKKIDLFLYARQINALQSRLTPSNDPDRPAKRERKVNDEN